MDFSHFYSLSVLEKEKLMEFGFVKNGESYTLKYSFENGFYAIVNIFKESITVDVYDDFDERYILLDIESANGSFVGKMREKVLTLMDSIYTACFISKDITKEYIKWINDKYTVEPDFPWEGDNETCVFRCPNNKWFGLIMRIPMNKLGFKSDDMVSVVNIKAEKNQIPLLIDNRSIFPAWHMNKKYWITVLLSSVTDFEKLCNLTSKSYELVNSKK